MEVVLPTLIITILTDEIISLFKKWARRKKPIKTWAISMFDLCGSTKMKITQGHKKGLELTLKHNALCKKYADKFDGNIIKYIGDEVFIAFEDPINACLAAIEIKKESIENGEFSTKGGITLGVVESIDIGGRHDLIATTVDKCARITSMAIPNQILVDSSLLQATEGFLRDQKILMSKPYSRDVKGLGEITVHEISKDPYELLGYGFSSLRMIEEGRMPLREKMTYLSSAKKEIVELGIGLTSFSDDYFRERASEHRNILKDILTNGVVINCLLLDPESDMAKIYVTDNEEPEYLKKMNESLIKLRKMKDEFMKLGLDGFNIYLYDSFPRFHASCIDINEPTGKLSISNYLPKIRRSDNPVLQFSKYSNPQLFSIYEAVIKHIFENSIKIS